MITILTRGAFQTFKIPCKNETDLQRMSKARKESSQTLPIESSKEVISTTDGHIPTANSCHCSNSSAYKNISISLANNITCATGNSKQN